jgi:hypothetical protein
LKLVDENLGETLEDIGTGIYFFFILRKYTFNLLQYFPFIFEEYCPKMPFYSGRLFLFFYVYLYLFSYLTFFSLFIYSNVHTLFEPFLPLVPPASFFPLIPLLPGRTCPALFSNFVEEKT